MVKKKQQFTLCFKLVFESTKIGVRTLLEILPLSDDLTDAYKTLRHLVMEYLGVMSTPHSDALGLSNTTSAFGLEKEATEMTGSAYPTSVSRRKNVVRSTITVLTKEMERAQCVDVISPI